MGGPRGVTGIEANHLDNFHLQADANYEIKISMTFLFNHHHIRQKIKNKQKAPGAHLATDELSNGSPHLPALQNTLQANETVSEYDTCMVRRQGRPHPVKNKTKNLHHPMPPESSQHTPEYLPHARH